MTLAEKLRALDAEHPMRDMPDPLYPEDIEPGCTEYQCRRAIRDLIRMTGFEATREYVASVLLDEGGSRTINHNPREFR